MEGRGLRLHPALSANISQTLAQGNWLNYPIANKTVALFISAQQSAVFFMCVTNLHVYKVNNIFFLILLCFHEHYSARRFAFCLRWMSND